MKRVVIILTTIVLFATIAMAGFNHSYTKMNWNAEPTSRDYIPAQLKLWMIESENMGCVDTVTLEPNDIKALYSSPKTLVAAPGAHNVIEFTGAMLFYDYRVEAYGNAGNNMTIKYTNGSGAAVSGTLSGTGFLTATSDTVAKVIPVAVAATAATGVENQPLVLCIASADPNGGADANAVGIVRVKISYRVHPSGF